MARQYVCQNAQRHQLVQALGMLNGIDYLEVVDQEAPPLESPRQRTLLVRCLQALPEPPDNLSAANVRIEGGVRITTITITWAARAAEAETLFASGLISAAEKAFFLEQPEPTHLLLVRTGTSGDFSTYRLKLVKSPTSQKPPTGFDPILSAVAFSFKADCPSDFDCQSAIVCPPEDPSDPRINYLAKDYASFRTLMLDRLSTIMPTWQERNAADLGMVLVEALAYTADYLSYYQDAVATEAYLGTARQRISVRRHARLLDYRMHEGCNARTWVQVQVDADNVLLAQGTPLLTRVVGQATRLVPASPEYERAVAQQPDVFETMHDITLYMAHNAISFYTWGDSQCCLPQGATCATLGGDLPHLQAGDVLIFEERLGPDTGLAADANPAHRQAVRLTSMLPDIDPLNGQAIVDITWAEADALTFPLCLSTVIADQTYSDVGVVRGNIVLADHGRTITAEKLEAVPASGRYRPRLEATEVTHRQPYDHDVAQTQAAAEVLRQDPSAALPVVALSGDGATWTAQYDLLNSHRFAAEFVVEVEGDGSAYLRFGDGVLGTTPPAGMTLTATYRSGNGEDGHVGAESIAHVVTNTSGIAAVRNPLPAQGGTDAESIEAVRLAAPQAFRTQQRAVTEADYAAVAERHADVHRAVATRRWTGSWYTMFITVDRQGGKEVDDEFEAELRAFLERYRLAGHDLEIDGPHWVPLDIVFTVCVKPGYFRSDVEKALLDAFSNTDWPDGRRGFFHPDNFTFGQSVYLSPIVATAMQVPGVLWVDTDYKPPKRHRFQRWGERPRGELAAGRLEIGHLEIARLDNDPNAPENGRMMFHMEGGA